ncbi:hypothetical protein, partial [Mycobacterium gordonae]|uniref:hypothetical protein n=1 Tax=Mycobacterium gordonae TaxID=1778 RepID=UPI000A7D27D8
TPSQPDPPITSRKQLTALHPQLRRATKVMPVMLVVCAAFAVITGRILLALVVLILVALIVEGVNRLRMR